jgi:PAS domain S-box-containing protein
MFIILEKSSMITIIYIWLCASGSKDSGRGGLAVGVFDFVAKQKSQFILPGIVLVIALFALGLAANDLRARHEMNLFDHFSLETHRISLKLKSRMGTYNQILRGAAGLFAGSEKVGRDEWRSYFDKLNLEQEYGGIQGLGFALYVPSDKLQNHIAEIKAEGFPDYVIKPEGKREEYSSIIYLEPFSGRNLRAFGYDMFSEPIRHKAMELARDSGAIAYSGKVKLVQETQSNVQFGFLVYHPVYAKKALLQTPEQRRANFVGWAYSPFRMHDMVEQALHSELKNIRLEIFDGNEINFEGLMYDSHPPQSHPDGATPAGGFVVTDLVELEGHFWTLRYTALPAYMTSTKFEPPWVEVGALISIALLLAAMSWAWFNTKRNAKLIAAELTASLRASEQRLNLALQGTNDGLWDWNVATGQVYYSPRAETMLGYEPGEFESHVQAWEERLHPEDKAMAMAALECHLSGMTKLYSAEFRLLAKNGGWVWVLGRGKVVERSANGKPLRAVGTNTDISAQKELENKLAESLDRFARLSEMTTEGIVIHDGKIIMDVNASLCRLFGYSPRELISTEVLGLLTESGQKLAKEHIAAKSDEPYIAEMLRKDGSTFIAEIFGRNVVFDGKPVRVASVRDITERQKADAELRSLTEALRRSNADLEQFSYAISHDLQAPLRNVTSYLQLLERRYKDKLDDDAREFIDFAIGGGKRMANMIHDLLEYSRVHSNGDDFSSVNLNDAAKDARLNLQANIEEAKAEIKITNLPTVQGDPGQLMRLFQNLIGNAIKYRRPDMTPEISISLGQEGDEWIIAVADNGIGIDPSQRSRLFAVFQRLHNGEAYEGTGIGLAICKRIIERHSGRIWIETSESGGSVFVFTLPMA